MIYTCAPAQTDIGVKLRPDEIVQLCQRMQLECEYQAATDTIKVVAPPTRSDLLHPVDIVEDVAVAFGYTRIKATQPVAHTVGREQPLNALSDLIRGSVAEAGYTEVCCLTTMSSQLSHSSSRLHCWQFSIVNRSYLLCWWLEKTTLPSCRGPMRVLSSFPTPKPQNSTLFVHRSSAAFSTPSPTTR